MLAVIAVLAVIATIRVQPGIFRPAPPRVTNLGDWSFESFPIPMFDDLSREERELEDSKLEDVPTEAYCEVTVRVRYETYQKRYPRYLDFADGPVAFQRFLHHMALRADHPGIGCPVVHLLHRVFDEGANRCDLNILRNDNDPVLQRDMDKVIELVEYRHYLMVSRLLSRGRLINSNDILWGTRYYLVMTGAVDVTRDKYITDTYEFDKRRILSSLPERDPKRVQFIADAARRNDFRSVLRTNGGCRKDRR